MPETKKDEDGAVGIKDKPDGIDVSQKEDTGGKDDCSDLTDAHAEEQAPKSFPQKLMEILSEKEHEDVISWLPHGNGFIIHKKKTFASDILPKHFKASKFTSFTRKLNRWGFTRVPRGPETGAYFHKLFQRDKPELCLQMTSNSGNKYQANTLQQHLMPNNMPQMGGMGMFPYMNPMMAANMSPQQQQAMWQQQMQQMMQLQQMHMMQMQQQQQQQNQQASAENNEGKADGGQQQQQQPPPQEIQPSALKQGDGEPPAAEI